MAISIGATKSQTCDTSNGASFSHTVDSGTDLLVVACMGYAGGTGNELVSKLTALTWTKSGESGQSGTAIVGDASDGGQNWSDEQLMYWIVPNPNVGAGTIASTADIPWIEGIQYYAFNLIGVDVDVGTSGVRDSGSNSASSGTTISETLTTVAGDFVLAWAYIGADSSVTVQSGQTAIASNLGACGGAYSSLSYEEAVGTSTAVGYQDIGTSEWRALHAIAIAPAAGGGPVVSIPVVMNHLRNQGIL